MGLGVSYNHETYKLETNNTGKPLLITVSGVNIHFSPIISVM